jgi:hypothetical protein
LGKFEEFNGRHYRNAVGFPKGQQVAVLGVKEAALAFAFRAVLIVHAPSQFLLFQNFLYLHGDFQPKKRPKAAIKRARGEETPTGPNVRRMPVNTRRTRPEPKIQSGRSGRI